MKRRTLRLLSCLCVLAMAISLLPAAWAAEPTPLKSTVAGGTYNGNWAVPIDAYLYQDGDNLVRVENFKGVKIVDTKGNFIKWSAYPRLVAETYDSNFRLISSVDLDMELDLWGGFYAGEDYNFLIFGQENPSENDNAEVIRVVKYDKNWNRLGQASLRGANTTTPFDAGSVRCDECNGYLYVRTSHEMYRSGDGYNHQANLTFSVRQSDMTITDGYDDAVANQGYVSHSFNQFILVDSQNRLVALDHGDAYPARGAVLSRYDNEAGNDTFTKGCKSIAVTTWSGTAGENTTGANVTDLAETSSGYLVAYSSTGKGSASTIGKDPMNIFLSYTDKDNFSSSGTTVRQLTSWPSGSDVYGSQPLLVPTGPDGGYILWEMAEKWDNGYYYNQEAIQYASYSADGTISDIRTADGVRLSRCHPISYDGKVVWYSTYDSTPVFYVLDDSGVRSYPVEGSGQQQPDPDPEPTPDPEPMPDPDPTPDPGDTDSVGVERMLAAPTIDSQAALKTDGSVWMWGTSAADLGKYNQQSQYNVRYQDSPIKVMDDCLSVGDFWCVKKDHSLWMWGNESAISGDYRNENKRSQPVKVMDDVAYFDGNYLCYVALKTDGTLWGWGDMSCLTGDDTRQDMTSVYQAVKLMDNVKQAQCTGWGWMALKEDGSLWSCGISNLSNLNAQDYVFGNQLIPLTHVMDDVAAFDLAWQNTMVIKTDGSLWTWGDSSCGQIGNGGDYGEQQGNNYWYDTPYKVMDDVVYASAGSTAYAITSDGTLYGWGRNENNQLNRTGGNYTGLGDFYDNVTCQSTPVVVAKDVYAVAHSDDYGVLFLKKDGSLWVCGPSVNGDLGIPGTDRVNTLTKLMDGVALSGAAGGQSASVSFSDVPANQWYADYAVKAAQAGLMQGTGGGKFSPDGTLTVAEVVTLTARLYAERQGESVPVVSGMWYQGAYDYCIENGLFMASEVPLSTMMNKATRFQMVDLLDRAVPEEEKQVINVVFNGEIPDVQETDPYGPVVYLWYRAGIVEGDSSGRFHGNTNISRAETAAILCRLADLTPRV